MISDLKFFHFVNLIDGHMQIIKLHIQPYEIVTHSKIATGT